jgi:hypothetical protein
VTAEKKATLCVEVCANHHRLQSRWFYLVKASCRCSFNIENIFLGKKCREFSTKTLLSLKVLINPFQLLKTVALKSIAKRIELLNEIQEIIDIPLFIYFE